MCMPLYIKNLFPVHNGSVSFANTTLETCPVARTLTGKKRSVLNTTGSLTCFHFNTERDLHAYLAVGSGIEVPMALGLFLSYKRLQSL